MNGQKEGGQVRPRPLAGRARVTPFVVEATSGAITPRALAFVSYLATRTRGASARDGTNYGSSKMSAKSYYVHHTQRLSKAAACGNVMGIHDSIRAAKQRMAADTARPHVGAGGPGAT